MNYFIYGDDHVLVSFSLAKLKYHICKGLGNICVSMYGISGIRNTTYRN